MPYKDPKKKRENWLKWYRKNYPELLERKRAYWKAQREFVLRHYSNGKLECACCKEKIYEFLSLDHKHGGGTKHRKSLGSKYILSWLIQNGLPKGYRVLCHNCNSAIGFYGKCPHGGK